MNYYRGSQLHVSRSSLATLYNKLISRLTEISFTCLGLIEKKEVPSPFNDPYKPEWKWIGAIYCFKCITNHEHTLRAIKYKTHCMHQGKIVC